MPIIRPSLRLHIGHILIALVAAIVAAALIPVAAGAGGPKGPHLVFRLSGKFRQDVIGSHSIVIRARCPTEACTVVASASSKSPAFRTASVHARVPAGAGMPISVPLASRDRGKLKAAFEAGHSPVLTVKAVAHDGAGDRVPLSLAVHARKP